MIPHSPAYISHHITMILVVLYKAFVEWKTGIRTIFSGVDPSEDPCRPIGPQGATPESMSFAGQFGATRHDQVRGGTC